MQMNLCVICACQNVCMVRVCKHLCTVLYCLCMLMCAHWHVYIVYSLWARVHLPVHGCERSRYLYLMIPCVSLIFEFFQVCSSFLYTASCLIWDWWGSTLFFAAFLLGCFDGLGQDKRDKREERKERENAEGRKERKENTENMKRTERKERKENEKKRKKGRKNQKQKDVTKQIVKINTRWRRINQRSLRALILCTFAGRSHLESANIGSWFQNTGLRSDHPSTM